MGIETGGSVRHFRMVGRSDGAGSIVDTRLQLEGVQTVLAIKETE